MGCRKDKAKRIRHVIRVMTRQTYKMVDAYIIMLDIPLYVLYILAARQYWL